MTELPVRENLAAPFSTISSGRRRVANGASKRRDVGGVAAGPVRGYIRIFQIHLFKFPKRSKSDKLRDVLGIGELACLRFHHCGGFCIGKPGAGDGAKVLL